MILLDLSTSAVTVEADGDHDRLLTVRTLQTEGSSSRVARWVDQVNGVEVTAASDLPMGRQEEIEESVRSRSGSNVLREYDITEPGVYAMTSGRRELQQNRTFYVRLAFHSREFIDVTILPGSFAPVSWVLDEGVHNYREGETLSFRIRVTNAGVGLEEAEIARITSDRSGTTFERTTAWDRVLKDDEPDSV